MSVNSEHFIIKCSCGVVMSQCRCPSRDKVETIVSKGCSNCHGSTARVEFIREDAQRPWKITAYPGVVVYLSEQDWKAINAVIHEHYHGED